VNHSLAGPGGGPGDADLGGAAGKLTEGDQAAGLGLLAGQAIALLTGAGHTVAVAESLTGGMLAATLVSVPGASAAFRGGVVAYATDLKASLLGVPAGLLERHGAVHPDVAAAMAEGARRRLSADFGVGTTGVAGPEPADGQPAGTVFIAVSGLGREAGRALTLTGYRQAIRVASVRQALALLISVLREHES
jgi:nicotinamide-nucleotide amidase